MHERKQTGSSAKLLCGGMRPGGAPRAAGRHVRAGQSRAEPSRARNLQFVSMVACACASLGLICGPNGNRQDGTESKCTAANADWVSSTAECRAKTDNQGGGREEREEAALGSWQRLRSLLPAQTINKERKRKRPTMQSSRPRR